MITLDATSTNSGSGITSLTVSHTVSGGDRMLIVGVGTVTDILTGVTYNGVAMTRVDVQNNGNSTAYVYYLIGPDVGTHDIVASTSASSFISVGAASFTGVKQSAPEATVKNTASATNAIANTLTTLTDNAMHFAMYQVDTFPVTSITNGTLIGNGAGYSNALLITPPGAHTMTGNSSGGNNTWATVGAAFAPSTGGTLDLTSKIW